MPPPRLSVVVLAWNEREDLRACLGALAGAEAPGGLEVVVVDNGSTDGTAELLAATPWVRTVTNARNVGVAPGRNAGVAAASGTDVAFLDSDTLVGPQTLRILLGALDDDPGLGLVGPRLVYDDGTLQLSCRRVPGPAAVVANRVGPLLGGRLLGPARRYLMTDAPHDRTMEVDYVLGAAMLVRGRALREAGGVDPGSTPGGYGFDDLALALAVRERGWRVAYVPEAVARHGYRRRLASRPMSAGTFHLARSLFRVRRAHARAVPRVTRPPCSGDGNN